MNKIKLVKSQKQLLGRLIPLLLNGPKNTIYLASRLTDFDYEAGQIKTRTLLSVHGKLNRLASKDLLKVERPAAPPRWYQNTSSVNYYLSKNIWSLTPLVDLIQDELGVICE